MAAKFAASQLQVEVMKRACTLGLLSEPSTHKGMGIAAFAVAAVAAVAKWRVVYQRSYVRLLRISY